MKLDDSLDHLFGEGLLPDKTHHVVGDVGDDIPLGVLVLHPVLIVYLPNFLNEFEPYLF